MSGEITIPTTCTFVKQSGDRCQARRLNGSTFCYFHSPGTVADRAAARRRGGRNRHAGTGAPGTYTIHAPRDVLAVLQDALNDVQGLENTHGRARTIGYLSQVILHGFEVSEIEVRLRALEAKVGGPKRK
jgi:hypothetical protein